MIAPDPGDGPLLSNDKVRYGEDMIYGIGKL